MVLLEREECLLDLDRWQFTTAGGGCIALVYGELGIGKTALVREFARRQQQPERRVLWGTCDALFTPRALAPLHDIARQAKGALLDALNSGADSHVIFSAVLDDLERGTPATVVFEDMQWADEATLDLLKFIGRRIDRTHAMLVLTYRNDETGPRHPLRSVIGDLPREHTRRMELGALSEQAVAKLARHAGRQPANLHSLTGGNPQWVTEVLADGASDVPVSIRDVVLARAMRLTPLAQEIAELVCVVPGRIEARLLEHAGLSDEVAIESCLNIGLTRDNDGSLAFRHEIVRLALEGSLSNVRRQSLQAKVMEIRMPDRLARSARFKLDRGDWSGCSEDVETMLRNPLATSTARVAALTALAQIRIRRGDPDSSSPLEEAQMLAGQLGEANCLATLAAVRAEAAWLNDDRVTSELTAWLFRASYVEWRAAADAWKVLECPYEHATLLALYGDEAQKREALAIFERLGAFPAARAIRKKFRADGVKRVPRGARPTTQGNQFGLTKREAEVLSLLSQGMRNSTIARALFVSQKTVDHHVSAILAKLGVPSRGAAVVATRAVAAKAKWGDGPTRDYSISGQTNLAACPEARRSSAVW